MEEQPVAVFALKLALWHTKTFRPIMTHDELEPIMATIGFVALPPLAPPSTRSASAATSTTGRAGWTEYRFRGKMRQRGTSVDGPPGVRPRVRLPFPRIDGLHVFTYRAFCEAVAFYLGVVDIADIFHVRGLPLHPVSDRPLEQFRRLREDGQYFYRDGTLDHESLSIASANDTTSLSAIAAANATGPVNNANPITISSLVALTDIIV